MSDVRYNSAKNRVYITVDELLTLEKAAKHKEAIMKVIDQTKPGFTLLINLFEGKVQPSESTLEINKAREYGVKKGAKKAALVTNNPVLSMQASRTIKQVENAYEQRIFKTIEEAEAYLNE